LLKYAILFLRTGNKYGKKLLLLLSSSRKHVKNLMRVGLSGCVLKDFSILTNAGKDAGEKVILCTLLAEMKISAATMEISMEVPHKPKNRTLI
jgi:hypothetical protein